MATNDARPPADDARHESERNGAAARDFVSRLLDRPPPAQYLEAWTRSLEQRLGDAEAGERISVGIFRVADELFALPTEVVLEVQPTSPVRSVPGRTSEVFRGLVSLRGEIHLCASLRALLGLGMEPADTADEERRLLVVESGGERWALVVDAVMDFERFAADALQGAQVTVSKAAVHFTDGVLETAHGAAARIDPRRLFEGLSRSLA